MVSHLESLATAPRGRSGPCLWYTRDGRAPQARRGAGPQPPGTPLIQVHMAAMTSKTLSLLCAVTLMAAGPASAQDGGSPRAVMADAMGEAMLRMMEAMGMFGAGSLGGGTGMPGMAPPFGSLMGMPGASSWAAPMQDPSKAMGLGSDMLKQMVPGASGGTTGGGSLDGVWEGSGGDLLIVQGGRYRIYAPKDQYVDGILQQQSNRVALYNAEDGHTQFFEVARDDGRLALRDASGQVFLFRRFGSGAAGAAAPLSPVVPETPKPAAPSAPKTAGPR